MDTCSTRTQEPVGAENLIWRTDQGRCTRKNVGTCRATYVPHSVAPAVRPDPDGELEILVSNPIGVFGTHRLAQGFVVGGSPGVVLLDSATCCHDHACDESKDPTNDCGGKTKLHDGKRSGRRIDMEPND